MLSNAEYNRAAVLHLSPARARWAKSAVGVFGFAALTAIGAAISIPLPHTPVPLTLQTLAVLLAGVTLGPRRGLAAMALYLLAGAAGYHVFADGCWGLATVCGGSGGYLLGFALAQPLIGWLAGQHDGVQDAPTWRRLALAVLAGEAVIYGCGLLWLGAWLHTSMNETLALGLLPFATGELLKAATAVAIGRLVSGRAGAPR